MAQLRLRRADSAPGGPDEYFARLGESAIRDTDLSDAALRVLAAVILDVGRTRARVSLATNDELAWATGKKPRTVTRLLAELVDRGHLVIEPVKSIAGCPRGLRPVARLRPRKPQETAPGPAPEVATRVVKSGDAPGQKWLGASPLLAISPDPSNRKRTSEGEISQSGPASPARAGQAPPSPPSRAGTETPEATPEGIAEARALAARGGHVARMARRLLRDWGIDPAGACDGPGVTLADPPGAGLGSTLPDGSDCTTPRPVKSRSENRMKHKPDYQ